MRITLSLIIFAFLSSCNQNSQTLPVYGNKTATITVIKGLPVEDSVDYTIPPFSFLNQDSIVITNAIVLGRVYVVDFFFTSCPSICPKMKKEMLKVYNKYKANQDVKILSFSIDPKRDSVSRLKSYAGKLGIDNSSKWSMLTGEKDSIYSLANSFLVSAAEDPDAPGGHVHSGNFILVDRLGRIRGYYDGTSAESVDKLLLDMDILLAEKPE